MVCVDLAKSGASVIANCKRRNSIASRSSPIRFERMTTVIITMSQCFTMRSRATAVCLIERIALARIVPHYAKIDCEWPKVWHGHTSALFSDALDDNIRKTKADAVPKVV